MHPKGVKPPKCNARYEERRFVVPQWTETVRKIWRDLFWDQHGLNLPAVSYGVAWSAAIIVAIRSSAISGQFDTLQYALGSGALAIGYGAAAGSRLRTNSRFKRLEERLAVLEAKHSGG